MKTILQNLARRFFSDRTISMMRFDLLRYRVRRKQLKQSNLVPGKDRLHFGCGERRVQGWLNVDISSGDQFIDLSCGQLPWKSEVFSSAASQHFIEHIELSTELIPLLKEIHRVLRAGGELWVSCPDISRVCQSYVTSDFKDLISDREKRALEIWKQEWKLDAYSRTNGVPPSHMFNCIVYQQSEHRNLFDYDLLFWTLKHCGFVNIQQRNETDFLAAYPAFPERKDDLHTIYMSARKPAPPQ